MKPGTLALLASLLCMQLVSGFSTMAQTEGKEKKNPDPPKVSVNSDIPAEFQRLSKGLPESKRQLMLKYLWQLQFLPPYPRMHAAREIYWFKDKESIPYLVTALRDKYWGVRQAAAIALANIGVKEYSYRIYVLPDQEKYHILKEKLSGQNLPLDQKGDALLREESAHNEVRKIDIVKELKMAYYREVTLFKDPHAKLIIRQALETMGVVQKISISDNPEVDTEKK